MLRFFVLIVFCELEIATYVVLRLQGQLELVVLLVEGELKSNLGSLHDRRIVAAILVAFVDQIKALTAVHIGMRDPAVEERHGAVVEGILVLVVNIAILAGESVLNK